MKAQAEEIGAKVEERAFPDGHAPWTSLLTLIRDLRGALEAQIVTATGASTSSAEATRELARRVDGLSKIVRGMCAFVPARALARRIEAALKRVDDDGERSALGTTFTVAARTPHRVARMG